MGCCGGLAKPPEDAAAPASDEEDRAVAPVSSDEHGTATRPEDVSIYDLCEDDQLTLATRRSLDEDGNPESTGGPDLDGAWILQSECGVPLPSVAVPRHPAEPEMSVHRYSTPEVAGGDGGGGPPTAAPSQMRHPGPSSSSSSGARAAHNADAPEWAGQVTEDAAAGPSRGRVAGDGDVEDTSLPPFAGRSLGGQRAVGQPDEAAGGAPVRAISPAPPPPRPPPTAQPARVVSPPGPPRAAAGSLPPAVDSEVKKALELAKAKQFAEADQCLAKIGSSYPEHKDAREVVAAREAVAMCKQFHSMRA